MLLENLNVLSVHSATLLCNSHLYESHIYIIDHDQSTCLKYILKSMWIFPHNLNFAILCPIMTKTDRYTVYRVAYITVFWGLGSLGKLRHPDLNKYALGSILIHGRFFFFIFWQCLFYGKEQSTQIYLETSAKCYITNFHFFLYK